MFNRMAVASLFLGLVLASVPGVLEAASGSGRNKAGKVEGVLTFLSANRVVIRNQSGTAVSPSCSWTAMGTVLSASVASQ